MKQLKQTKKLLQYIKKEQEKQKKMLFFFDYDGVLVPIQDNPYTTYLGKKTKDRLILLSSSPNKVALVSGRDLKTLKKLTRIKTKKVTFIGTHGLEIQNLKSKNQNLKIEKTIELKNIRKECLKIANNIAKGFLENKPCSFTYHIRDKMHENLVNKLYRTLKIFLRSRKLDKKINILKGKRLVELMPKNFSKGKAVEKIIKNYPGYFYIYFGDDITDISAFKAVKKYKGISVSFNKKLNYKADFLVKSQKDINAILSGLVNSNKLKEKTV